MNLLLSDPAFLSVAASGGAPWTPTKIATALWLDAADASTLVLNGSKVSQWRDKSGNNNHLSQATTVLQPEYQAIGGANGGPTISIENSYILGDIISPTRLRNMSAIDVIMVLESAIAALPDAPNMSFWGYTRTASSAPWFWWGSSTGALAGETLVFFYSVGANTDPRIGSTTYSRPANTLQIFNTRNSTLGTSAFSDGSPVNLNLSNIISTSTNTAPASISLASDSFTLGGTGNPDNVGSNTGKICEVVVSDSLFSNDNRQRIEGYLAHKWGITANLPSDHPYKSAAPTV